MTTPNNKLPMLAGNAALLPIYPTSFEEVFRLATLVVAGGMVKPQKSKDDNDNWVEEDVEQVKARATMLIMQGMELGIPPMQAIQLIAMINGRMTVHSEGVPGLLLTRGFKIARNMRGTPMADDWTAVCTLTRPDGQVFVGEFSVAQAKRAKLWSPNEKIRKFKRGGASFEADNDSPWHKYPDRMLWARALGFAARDGAADAMRGMMVREEMEDMLRPRNQAEDAQVISATPEPTKAVEHKVAVPSDVLDFPDPDATPVAAADPPTGTQQAASGEVDEENEDTVNARAAIKSATSIDMLNAVAKHFPEADWEVLEQDYADKHDQLE